MENTLASLRRENERLRADLDRKVIPSSQSCKDLANFVEKTPEPLYSKAESNNVFRQKATGCTIL